VHCRIAASLVLFSSIVIFADSEDHKQNSCEEYSLPQPQENRDLDSADLTVHSITAPASSEEVKIPVAGQESKPSTAECTSLYHRSSVGLRVNGLKGIGYQKDLAHFHALDRSERPCF
jgi:hypothetical protein